MGSSRVPAPLTRDEPLLESCLLECQKVATSISKAATEISAEFYINVNLKIYFMFVTILLLTSVRKKDVFKERMLSRRSNYFVTSKTVF